MRMCGDSDRGECFHFNPRLGAGRSDRGDIDPVIGQFDPDINVCQGEGMAEGDQFCRALSGHNSREACSFEWIALGGAPFANRDNSRFCKTYNTTCLRSSRRLWLGADVDHCDATVIIEMGQLVGFLHTL